ncbi:MAG: chlorophyll synthase ChlG [Pseudomonadota bacterium]
MTGSPYPMTLQSRPHWRDVLELFKPVTWFPPMWAFACGVVSTGQATWSHWPFIIGGVFLAGPMVCAASQAVNDWYDRHVDAINEPDRPIPSGRIPGRWGLYLGIFWSAMSLLIGAILGIWAFVATIVGVALAWLYSAPPVRFKEDGWSGPAIVGIAYEGVAWFTGAAVIMEVAPGPYILVAVLLYSFGAHGIMTLNDFKAIEGDRQSGVRSLPVRLGVERAAQVACLVMLSAQLLVIIGLVYINMFVHAALVSGLVLVQLWLMRILMRSPEEKAPWFNATGTLLYVLGMLVTAFALGSIDGGPAWTIG